MAGGCADGSCVLLYVRHAHLEQSCRHAQQPDTQGMGLSAITSTHTHLGAQAGSGTQLVGTGVAPRSWTQHCAAVLGKPLTVLMSYMLAVMVMAVLPVRKTRMS